MKRWRNQLVAIICVFTAIFVLFVTVYKYGDSIKVIQLGDATLVKEASQDERVEQVTVQTTTENGLPVKYQIPGEADLSGMDDAALNQIYWKYINMLQILCKDIIRVGSMKDGGKEICIDPPYKPEAPCMVYSFGINYMFDFDRDIVDLFGCDVHCFDPSMKNNTQRISEHIWFYKWGLGASNHINGNNWEIKTLDTIRRQLGHTNKTIDILKIDIEGDEWNTIPQMISSGALDDVRQISMETHFSSKHPMTNDYWGNLRPSKQLLALKQLYDFGYRTFMRERNMWSHFQWPGIRAFSTLVNEISVIKPKR